MMIRRFPWSAFLFLGCFLESDGLTVPQKNLAQRTFLTRTSTIPNQDIHFDKRLLNTSSKCCASSPLFARPLHNSNDGTVPRISKIRTLWKSFLWKLAALFAAATILISPAPANANDSRGSYFTPEMEVSVATLAEKREEVSFWYPEMEQDAAKEQEEQQDDEEKETNQQSVQSHAKKTASSNKNRGGHSPTFSMELIENESKMDLVSIPLLVINTLAIVAATIMRQEETAESLRKRFSYPGRSTITKREVQESLRKLVQSAQQKWNTIRSTVRGVALAANAGLGLGLEEANDLFKDFSNSKADRLQYEGVNDVDIVYQFDYDAVDALLSIEDASSHAANPNSLEVAAQRIREEDVSKKMEKVKLHRSEHQNLHTPHERDDSNSEQTPYGLCRSTPIERLFGDCRSIEPYPKKIEQPNKHIMLQRSSSKGRGHY